jgi:hypothetical protein
LLKSKSFEHSTDLQLGYHFTAVPNSHHVFDAEDGLALLGDQWLVLDVGVLRRFQLVYLACFPACLRDQRVSVVREHKL